MGRSWLVVRIGIPKHFSPRPPGATGSPPPASPERQRLASSVRSRQAAGPRRRAGTRDGCQVTGNGQDGCLVTGSLRCWGSAAGRDRFKCLLRRDRFKCLLRKTGSNDGQRALSCARETGSNACGRSGRFHGEGSCTRAAAGRAGGAGRTQDSPPHPPAARGGTSGSGPDDGCRGRVCDTPGAVRRRTRRRRFGEHALARSGVGRPLNANVPEPCFQTPPLGDGGGAGGRLRRYAGATHAAVGRASRRGDPWCATPASPTARGACKPPCPPPRPDALAAGAATRLGTGCVALVRAWRWALPPTPAPWECGTSAFFRCSPGLVDTRASLPPHLQQGTIGASHASHTALGKVSSVWCGHGSQPLRQAGYPGV
jgi:hypothetical protein